MTFAVSDGSAVGSATRAINVSDQPAAPLYLDNGQGGFATTGSWTPYNGQGYQNDVHFSAAGNGGDTASWTFSNLPAGSYRVSATWSVHPNRATDAPFTILDGTTPLNTVDVNQEQAPDDLLDDNGADWEDLGGPYTINSGTLVVRLTDDANEFVIADAIRIALVLPI